MKANLKKINFSLIINLCMIFVAAVFVSYLFMELQYGLPSFDGAMNLQVPKAFLRTGKYKTTYHGGILFDKKIQTRIPVLLPICILWKIFGIHYELAVLVNILYLLLLLYAVFYLCRELNIDKKAGRCLLMIILITPYMEEFAFGIYGEIPTLALMVMSILKLVESEKIMDDKIQIRKMIWSGFFYSAACLNKTVIFIALPSFLFIFAVKVIKDKSIRWKAIAVWFVAYVAPFLAEEGFHFIQMGKEAFLKGWKSELLDIVQQAGIAEKYDDTANIWNKLWKHAGIFCNDFSFKPGPVVFCLLLIFIFLIWMYRFFYKKEHGYENVILLSMCSYFGWWLLISTTAMAWPRRILIGVLLLEMIICEDINRLFLKVHIEQIWNLLLAVFSLAFIVILSGKIGNVDKQSKEQVLNLAETIKEIHEDTRASFYGFGWWQAPVLSFFSDVDFYDLYSTGELSENTYLVVDQYAVHLAGEEIENISNGYKLKLVEKEGDNSLYRISIWDEKDFIVSSSFSDEDYSGVVQSTYESKEEYPYIKGVYGYEEVIGSRWAAQNVELLLLKKEEQNRINIDLSIPEIENLSNKDPTFYVFIDNQLIRKQSVSSLDGKNISVHLADMNISNGVKDVRIYFNSHMLLTNGDSRMLAYQLKSVGFYK